MDNEQGSVNAGNPAAAGSQAPTQPQGQWFDAFPEDVRGTVQTKGWASPLDAIQSYTNLEKFLGADKSGRGLVIPKDDATPDEWGQVYDKLGRPTSPDQYKIAMPDGSPPEFAQAAAGKFHELGLNARQAEGLSAWWNQQAETMSGAQQTQTAQAAEIEMAQLQQEWGKEFDSNIEAGRRAARQFGADEAILSKMEGALGTKGMLQFFAKIGKGMGEDSFVDGSSGGKFGMSPEAARVRINQLKNDPTWSNKYLSGDADAKAELEKLMRSGYPS